MIHLEVVEQEDFNPTLGVTTADEISSGIQETGRIALYGIQFNTDSDNLKAESTPALQSIATAMSNNTALKVFVVGHMDNQGDYNYNVGLSMRRAFAAVQSLISNYGVSA